MPSVSPVLGFSRNIFFITLMAFQVYAIISFLFVAQSLSQFLPRPQYSGYSFKFNIEDKGSHAREEESSTEGHVTGKYSYMDPNGNLRVVKYNSTPENGFVAYGDIGVALLNSNTIGVSSLKSSLTTTSEEADTEGKLQENIPFENTFSDKENTLHVPTTKVLHFPKSDNLITHVPQSNFNGQISKTKLFDSEARLFNRHYLEDADKVTHDNNGVISSKNNDLKTFSVNPFSAASKEIRAAETSIKESGNIIPFRDVQASAAGDNFNVLGSPTNKVHYFPDSNSLTSHVTENNRLSITESPNSQAMLSNVYYFADADKMKKDKKLSGKSNSLLMKENEILKSNTELDKKIQDFLKSSSNSVKQQHPLSLPINFFPYFIYPTPHFVAVHPRPYML